MSACEECGYDFGAPLLRARDATVGLPVSLEAVLAETLVTDSTPRLRIALEVPTWSPLEYIGHLADVLPWYEERIKSLIIDERPILAPFDWDAHTASRNYNEQRLDEALGLVRQSCEQLVSLLDSLSPADLAREGKGSRGQRRTVAQLVHRAAHEAVHHLQDIRRGLGG